MAKNSKSKEADPLRPYEFYGLDFNRTGTEAVADCPFCGSENKFSVSQKEGMFRCFVCDEKGNHYSFIRSFWNHCKALDEDLTELAEERGVSIETLRDWGVCWSSLTDHWLVPGFNTKGELTMLYRYAKIKGGNMRLLCAPSPMGHALHGVDMYDSSCKVVFLCEGPWDAMKLYEVLKTTREVDGQYKSTTSKTNNLLKGACVLAVPGCSTFKDSWYYVFRGKKVFIAFDNDYPKTNKQTKKRLPPVGFAATQSVSEKLWSATKRPKSIQFLQWGEEGFDKGHKDGADVKDLLNTTDPRKSLKQLQQKFQFIPEEWKKQNEEEEKKIRPVECKSWMKLTNVWRKAMNWTEGLEYGLACMLATVTSTDLAGDQLWMKIVSPASSGKSTLCDAINVSNYVYSRSKIRGFHSGFKSDSDGEEDNSLIVHIRNKTLVTKDGDTLLSSPGLENILAEARDLYDGRTSSAYLNAINREYDGIRMTWLICGTASIRKLDSSELGARFLDCVIMDGIDYDQETAVLNRVFEREEKNLSVGGDDSSPNLTDPGMVRAQAITGGYVDYLRDNAQQLMAGISAVHVREEITTLARFVAYFRARPSVRQEEDVEREFAARLTSQFTRLAKCLALVMNKKSVDAKVMALVRKVALNTSRGTTQEICKVIHNYKLCELKSISINTLLPEARLRTLLKFLVDIEALEVVTIKPKKGGVRKKKKWRLKATVQQLMDYVLEDE